MRWFLAALLAASVLAAAERTSAAWSQEAKPAEGPQPGDAPSEPPFDDAAALARLRASIAGRERAPAESVFRNIQVLRGRPATAVLSVMGIGYRRSLGVHCTHCHDPGDWSSDAKAQKRIAREMSAMVRRINEELLASIEGLRGERPTVNCTTCHRGQVTPALDLAEPPEPWGDQAGAFTVAPAVRAPSATPSPRRGSPPPREAAQHVDVGAVGTAVLDHPGTSRIHGSGR